VKRAALPLVLLVGACAATPTPTRDELLEALRASGGAPATSEGLTHIACEQAFDAPSDFACRWRQRDGRRWQDWQAYLSQSSGGWKLVGMPSQRP
jgi:hypothetical protein